MEPAPEPAKVLSTATIARHVAAISSFYAYAVDEGLIPANPVKKGTRKRVAVDPDHSTTTGLSLTEAQQLLDGLAAEPARLKVAFLLLLLAGLRVSEVVGARWEHLGYDRGVRYIEVTRKGEEAPEGEAR